jgi:hypothetical protein
MRYPRVSTIVLREAGYRIADVGTVEVGANSGIPSVGRLDTGDGTHKGKQAPGSLKWVA